jgi:hypothetical protein
MIRALGSLSLLALLGTTNAAPPAVANEAGQVAAATVNAGAYPNLQAALDALPPSGGVVNLPPQAFEIREPLVVCCENALIRGAGAATHLINRNRSQQPALIVRPRDYTDSPRSRIWRVQLCDLRISGSPESGDGLLIQGVNELYLRGLAIDHNGGHGVHMVNCYEDPRIADCIITYNGGAGLNIVGGHDVVVSGNQFEENQDALRCIDSFNLCMSGNCVDDHLRHGVVIENTYGSVLSGNMIEECRGTAIVLERDCYGITVSANVIAHNNGGGVDLRDAWGCAVSANTFTICAGPSLAIGPGSGRITVTGNNFSNAHIGDTRRRDDPASGVVLDGTSDITITGNVFTGLAKGAVEVRGQCTRINVVGNVVSDASRSAPGEHAGMDLGEADASVEHNIVADDGG